MPAVVDQEQCTGCKSCVEACPNGAIEMAEEKAHVKSDECIDCELCVNTCPQQAIAMQ